MSTKKRKVPLVVIVLVLSILLACQYDLLYSSERIFKENQIRIDDNEVAIDDRTSVSPPADELSGSERTTVDSSTPPVDPDSPKETSNNNDGDFIDETLPLETTMTSSKIVDETAKTIRPLNPPLVDDDTNNDDSNLLSNSVAGHLDETLQAPLLVDNATNGASLDSERMNDTEPFVDDTGLLNELIVNDTKPLDVDNVADGTSSALGVTESANDAEPIAIDNETEDLKNREVNETESLTDNAKDTVEMENESVNDAIHFIVDDATGNISGNLTNLAVNDMEPLDVDAATGHLSLAVNDTELLDDDDDAFENVTNPEANDTEPLLVDGVSGNVTGNSTDSAVNDTEALPVDGVTNVTGNLTNPLVNDSELAMDNTTDLTLMNSTDTTPIVADNSTGVYTFANMLNGTANGTEPIANDNSTDGATAETTVNNTQQFVTDDNRTVITMDTGTENVTSSNQTLGIPLNANGTDVAEASSLSNSTSVSSAPLNESLLASSLPFVLSSDEPLLPHDSPFDWAACLLIRDDNKILPEWLAYHYETLPLRRLIIALDPFSDTDGTPIYEAYRSIGMNITIWQDEDYLYNGTRPYDRPVPASASVEAKRGSYLWRQRVFLSACLRQFKLENRTWVLLLDTDEYLAYHRYDVDEGTPFTCTNLPTEEEIAECDESYHRNQSSPRTGDMRTRLPLLGRPKSTFAHYLHTQWENLLLENEWNSAPCWVLPRSQWGAQESDNTRLQKRYLELGFNISNFHTLRFRKHGEMQNKQPGKPVVDVSRYDPFKHNVSSPHRLYRKPGLCKGGPFVKAAEHVFRVHHYTGTAEVFLSRPGRHIHTFIERQPQVVMDRTDDDVVGWLGAFARRVGSIRAKQLTEGLRAWAFETDAVIYAEIERKMEADPEYAALRDYRVKSDMIAEMPSERRRRLLTERLERIYR